jgi:serine/threonine protein kinase
MELSPGTTADRYVVESLLGRGGMATVYKVRHTKLGGLFALKVLHIKSRSIEQRLEQEGRLQAQLQHPNVLTVIDVIDLPEGPGLIMEMVTGGCLEDLLENGPISMDDIDDLVRGILAGVATAHSAGMVHRDLKPANVLLARGHHGLVPKVSDFGLAKALGEADHGMTRSGTSMGTPSYMSPEQVRDAKNVDLRTDVFALGAIMYEMVTGRKAFIGDDLFQVFSQVTSGTYAHPKQFVGDLPRRMSRAIAGALTVDREQRIQSVAELYEVWFETPPPPGLFGQAKLAPISHSLHPMSDETWHGGSQLGGSGTADQLANITQGPGFGTLAPSPSSSEQPSHVRSLGSIPQTTGSYESARWAGVAGIGFLGVTGLSLIGGAAVAVLILAVVLGPAMFTDEVVNSPEVKPAVMAETVSEPVPEPVPEPPEPEKPPKPPPEVAPKAPDPQPAVREVPRLKPAPVVAPEVIPEPEPEPAPIVAADVNVWVNARPYANVRLNGRDLGSTGLAGWKGKMPKGKHQLEISTSDGRTKLVFFDATEGARYCWNFNEDASCL